MLSSEREELTRSFQDGDALTFVSHFNLGKYSTSSCSRSNETVSLKSVLRSLLLERQLTQTLELQSTKPRRVEFGIQAAPNS